MRPLVKPQDDDGDNTKGLSREHTVLVSRSGLVTVTGGKWTTYRAMAEDVLSQCAEKSLIENGEGGVTVHLKLIGAEEVGVTKHSICQPPGLHSYGNEQSLVMSLPGAQTVICDGLTEAMVRFAARYEYAIHVEDVLARRSPRPIAEHKNRGLGESGCGCAEAKAAGQAVLPARFALQSIEDPNRIQTLTELHRDAAFFSLPNRPSHRAPQCWRTVEKNPSSARSRLEYRFSISSNTESGEKVMKAEEYYQGHLDWYNVDVSRDAPSLGDLPGSPPAPAPRKKVQTFIPSPVVFEGMPNTRWWAFEDSKTNFSYIKPDTTDLAKLLLMEFGLVYANDWYLIPYKLPVATLTKIKGLSLTNSFGENFWIEAAGKGDDQDWTRWNMFSMKVDSAQPSPADIDLLLLPTVAKIQESKPVEEVMFVRDEVANMVWAVETIVPLPSGRSKSGFEAAAEYHGYLQKLFTDQAGPVVVAPPVADGEEVAKIRYQAMNAVPENWIPFIPAHVEGSNREVQLQRAAMPRILDGDNGKPDKIRPRTALLQPGLAGKKPYFIHEEEVPRSGIKVAQSFQRTRWNGGKVFVWFGVRKETGRGEASSGLGFDRIVNRPADK